MASEIEVQTLKGPSGGANANKVLIPSGHTLDASEGFIPPAGHVVQSVLWKMTPVEKSTAGTWAVHLFPTILNTYVVETYNFTKKYSNSKVHATVSGHVDHLNATGSPSIVALIEKSNYPTSETFMGAAYRHVRVHQDEPLTYAFSGEDAVAGINKQYSICCHSHASVMRFGRPASGTNASHVFTILLQEIAQ